MGPRLVFSMCEACVTRHEEPCVSRETCSQASFSHRAAQKKGKLVVYLDRRRSSLLFQNSCPRLKYPLNNWKDLPLPCPPPPPAAPLPHIPSLSLASHLGSLTWIMAVPPAATSRSDTSSPHRCGSCLRLQGVNPTHLPSPTPHIPYFRFFVFGSFVRAV